MNSSARNAGIGFAPMKAPELKLSFCSHRAAKYAVMKWHYSKAMPSGKLIKISVFEDDKFVGVVIYGRGATPEIGSPYGLKQTEVCELVRVALAAHRTQTSRILAISKKMLVKKNPGLKLIVSFADPEENHHGGIYQANGWLYVGLTNPFSAAKYKIMGKMYHPRSCHVKWGKGGQSIPWLRKHVDPNAEKVKIALKHKYVMPLSPEIKAMCEGLKMRYPKRAGNIDSDVLHPPVKKGRCNSDPGAHK